MRLKLEQAGSRIQEKDESGKNINWQRIRGEGGGMIEEEKEELGNRGCAEEEGKDGRGGREGRRR